MKLLWVGVSIVPAILAICWDLFLSSGKNADFKRVVQAIPIIRFEKFDKAHGELVVGIFNPGHSTIEISRTVLMHESGYQKAVDKPLVKEYGENPLVLDSGDTVLVRWPKDMPPTLAAGTDSYWGQFDFRIPGQADFYSIRHRFGIN